MTIYQHCKSCRSVQPCVETRLGRKCAVCGKHAWGWHYRVCGECGSRIYGPKKRLKGALCPCRPEAEEHVADGQPPQEKPVLIQWDDPAGNALLHVQPLDGPLPPFSKVVVRQKQRAICESGGERLVLGPGEHIMTRESLLQRELDRGIGGRIIFLDDRTGAVACTHTLSIKGGEWTVQLPFIGDFAFDCTREDNLLRRRIPLDSDEKARNTLMDAVAALVNEQLERVLTPVQDAPALAEAESADAIERCMKRLIGETAVNAVMAWVNMKLQADFGLMLTELRLDMAGVRAARSPVLIDLTCCRCGRVEQAPRSRRGERDSFLCSDCSWEEAFCPWCQGFRQVDRATGKCRRCGSQVR